MIEYKFFYNDAYISCFLFGGDKNIVFAAGLPQYIDKYHPLVKQAEKLKCNLFVPRYYGTYEDPKNKMTLAGCKEVIENTVELVKQKEAVELFANKEIYWNNPESIVVGFSFGALPALIQEYKVAKTILFCPFVSLKFHDQNTPSENFADTLDYLTRAFPGAYRFSQADFIKELKNVELPAQKSNLIVFKTKDDSVIPVEEIDFIAKKYKCKIIEKPGKHQILLSEDMLQ